MNEDANLRVVQAVYAAFGQGNVQGVLSRLAEEVEWTVAGGSEVPYAGTWRGRQGVAEWLALLGKVVEIQQFQPVEFVADEETVVVFGHERLKPKVVGRVPVPPAVIKNEWVQVFTVRDGRITRFREFLDTAAVASAFRGLPLKV